MNILSKLFKFNLDGLLRDNERPYWYIAVMKRFWAAKVYIKKSRGMGISYLIEQLYDNNP